MWGRNIQSVWCAALLASTMAFGMASQAIDTTVARSDVLLHIVSKCVEPSRANYCDQCNFPRRDGLCGADVECKKSTEVFALNSEYVAIRDSKMCGCPSEFFHGLAIPRGVITGVEDPNRPEGIWQFAWQVAAKRLELDSIALVVNPQSQRSQNQLHVHLVRLDDHARSKFDQYKPSYVDSLEHIWATAEKDARSKGLSDYGVLVARQSLGQYIVVTTPNSPEAAFTQWSCH